MCASNSGISHTSNFVQCNKSEEHIHIGSRGGLWRRAATWINRKLFWKTNRFSGLEDSWLSRFVSKTHDVHTFQASAIGPGSSTGNQYKLYHFIHVRGFVYRNNGCFVNRIKKRKRERLPDVSFTHFSIFMPWHPNFMPTFQRAKEERLTKSGCGQLE